MSVSHRFTNFGKSRDTNEHAGGDGDDSSLEDEKLQSFESGYKAGWDDAIKAQADDGARLSAEFSQNLQDIAFTYQDAVTKLSKSFEPVFIQVIEKVLPEICKETLAVHIAEQVQKLISDTIAQPVEIVVASTNQAKVKALLTTKLKEPFKLTTTSDIGEHEVFVRVGDTEKQIDFGSIIESVSKAATAFFHEIQENNDHG